MFQWFLDTHSREFNVAAEAFRQPFWADGYVDNDTTVAHIPTASAATGFMFSSNCLRQCLPVVD